MKITLPYGFKEDDMFCNKCLLYAGFIDNGACPECGPTWYLKWGELDRLTQGMVNIKNCERLGNYIDLAKESNETSDKV